MTTTEPLQLTLAEGATLTVEYQYECDGCGTLATTTLEDCRGEVRPLGGTVPGPCALCGGEVEYRLTAYMAGNRRRPDDEDEDEE